MLKKLIKFILGFIFFLIIQFCKFFINIRIGKFPSSRIGPFITSVEILAARKKELNIKYLIDFYNKLKGTDSDFFGKYFYRIAGNKKLENQIKELKNEWNQSNK